MHASLCRVPKCNTSKMKSRNSRKGESSCIPCERYVHTGLDFLGWRPVGIVGTHKNLTKLAGAFVDKWS